MKLPTSLVVCIFAYFHTSTLAYSAEAAVGESLLPVIPQPTLAQLKAHGAASQCGEIRDVPKYRVRSFMMDVGRMHHSMDFMYDLARTMSYYKMNVLHVHLNDNAEAEKFRAFQDAMFKMVIGFGCKPWAWGSLDNAKGETSVVAGWEISCLSIPPSILKV